MCKQANQVVIHTSWHCAVCFVDQRIAAGFPVCDGTLCAVAYEDAMKAPPAQLAIAAEAPAFKAAPSPPYYQWRPPSPPPPPPPPFHAVVPAADPSVAAQGKAPPPAPDPAPAQHKAQIKAPPPVSPYEARVAALEARVASLEAAFIRLTCLLSTHAT